MLKYNGGLVKYVMLCPIWYYLYNFKKVKNTHGGVLLLVKFHTKAWNFTKSNTPSWTFLILFKLCKWYHIAQRITYFKTFTNSKISIIGFWLWNCVQLQYFITMLSRWDLIISKFSNYGCFIKPLLYHSMKKLLVVFLLSVLLFVI